MSAELLSAKALTPLLVKLAGSLAEASKGPVAKAKDQLKVKLKIGFDEYIKQQIQRYSSIKTIISSNNPLPLKDLYVNLYLKGPIHKVRDDDFVRLGEENRRFVFTATAGSGKSMLMRYLYFQFLQEQSERLPVFVELREINDNPDQTILEHIRGKITDYIEGFTTDQLKYALKSGMIALFLDGYDEIDHDKRSKRGREINSLAGRYDDAIIFVSSRPDDSFSRWERFHVFVVEHLSENQVRNLIRKIPYDADSKDLFINKLDSGLYETHKEFLVNPLLTIMMLITLQQFAEVPAKIHLFYEYAFEALFSRHDAAKGGMFQRKRHVDLALDDYRRLFSYFCMVSYLKESFSFSESTALEFLQRSINSSQIIVKKDAMLDDLEQCTCMLVRDGLDYAFSHRSFQEYFVAYFLARIKADEFERFAPRLVSRGELDNVFLMISEMNKEKFEESWALPQLSSLYDKVKDIDVDNKPMDFITTMFGAYRATIHRNGSIHFSPLSSDDEPDYVRISLYHIYDLFSTIRTKLPEHEELHKSIVEKIIDGKILKDDKRFSSLRSPDSEVSAIRITLREIDNVWVKDTYLGQFVRGEKQELPRLLNDIKGRVEQRRAGLASIFDF